MKFVFEVVGAVGFNMSKFDRIRKMMICFENTINTVFPEIRVHLREEEEE